MSLNKIELNSFLLTEMYRKSLVSFNDITTTEKKIVRVEPGPPEKKGKKEDLAQEPWKYLGEYKKNILLVVRYADNTYLPDQQLSFLTSVLNACKLTLGDVGIINLANTPSTQYNDIHQRFQSSVTILFGLTPEEIEMPVNFPEFQVQAFNNCTFLHTPDLGRLETDKVLKSKLWVCLKRILQIP